MRRFHVNREETFLELKISVSPDNTKYKLGFTGSEINGSPDILWEDIIFVKETGKFYTHSREYNASGLSSGFNQAVSINGSSFDGTQDIVTDIWGKSREVTITDGEHKSDPVSVDGSGNISLLLPEVIDASVTRDSKGNIISDTYVPREEFTRTFDDLPSFFVYCSDIDADPTLDSFPAVEWSTEEEYNLHSGDYYITSVGRVFRFVQNNDEEWEWQDITDFYLYECLSDVADIRGRLNISDYWDIDVHDEVESGEIYVRGTQNTRPYLDVVSCPQFVNYSLSEDINLYLPFICRGVYTRTKTRYTGAQKLLTVNDLSRIVGKVIILGVKDYAIGSVNVVLGDNESETNRSIEVSPGESLILRLRVGDVDGYLAYMWDGDKVNPGITWY